jgi:hypothetical protein
VGGGGHDVSVAGRLVSLSFKHGHKALFGAAFSAKGVHALIPGVRKVCRYVGLDRFLLCRCVAVVMMMFLRILVFYAGQWM